jgi:hypothetical protein
MANPNHRNGEVKNFDDCHNYSNYELKQTADFVNKLDIVLQDINILITDELMDRTIQMKNNVEGCHENSIKKLSENFTSIREGLSELSVYKVEMLDKMKEKILSSILSMQAFYGAAMGDILEGI